MLTLLLSLLFMPPTEGVLQGIDKGFEAHHSAVSFSQVEFHGLGFMTYSHWNVMVSGSVGQVSRHIHLGRMALCLPIGLLL